MADIFISYVREDRDRVEVLANALADRGWSVWWDRDLPIGRRPFGQVIEEELAKACCVVTAWSSRSNVANWVLDEASYARDKGVLVPVLLEEVLPPLGFRQFNAVDLSAWDGHEDHPEFKRLADNIASITGKRSGGPAKPPASAARNVRSEVPSGGTVRPSPKNSLEKDANATLEESADRAYKPFPALVGQPIVFIGSSLVSFVIMLACLMLVPATTETISAISIFAMIILFFYTFICVFLKRYDIHNTNEIIIMIMSCFLIYGLGFVFIYQRVLTKSAMTLSESPFIAPGILCATLGPMSIALVRKIITKKHFR